MITPEDAHLIERLRQLPADYWDFKEEDTKEYVHGIHNYPAMMVCPISRNIIRLVREIQPVHALFDPFAGSGTVLVEGMLSGIQTVAGNDINPLALLLSKVKTTCLSEESLSAYTEELFQRIDSRREELSEHLDSVDSYITDTLQLDIAGREGWRDNAYHFLKTFCDDRALDLCMIDFLNMGYWFRPRVILELAIIKAEIERIPEQRTCDFIFIAFSECVRLVSNRRNGEHKMFRMKEEKVRRFRPDVYYEFQRILLRNIQKMQDFNQALARSGAASDVSIFCDDARFLENVPDDTYDLIVTSPPYGDSRTTVAYGEFSRVSLLWMKERLGLDEKAIRDVDKSLMGGKKCKGNIQFALNSITLNNSLARIKDADEERAKDVFSFYLDLDAAIGSIARKTRSGGYQFWVVGNRTVKEEVLQTDVIIRELALQHGLTPVFTVARNIPNKVMPTQNSPSNIPGETGATMTMEHIVILRKD